MAAQIVVERGLKADRRKMAYMDNPDKKRNPECWFTPKIYVNAARIVLGSIELDPYSSELANRAVCAERYFSLANPAETNEWNCETLFMNPPYGRKVMPKAVDKFVEEYKKYHFSAIVLTNNCSETKWCTTLYKNSTCVCHTDHRISFYEFDGKSLSNNSRGQLFFYYGNNADSFKREFKRFGYLVEYCNM